MLPTWWHKHHFIVSVCQIKSAKLTSITGIISQLVTVLWSPVDHQKLFCHQYFLYTISSTRYPPVSNWSNRPLVSGGNSSYSWVFYSCTGPNFRWNYTPCWLHSFHYTLELNTLRSTPAGKRQTSVFQCNLYWESAGCSWRGVTITLW